TPGLIAPLATPVHRLRQIFDALGNDTTAEKERVVDHLKQVPQALEQYFKTLSSTADRGYLVPQRQINVLTEQCESWVESKFFENLVSTATSKQTTREAEQAAKKASEAVTEFVDHLRSDLLPRATTTDARGREIYEVTSSAFLGAKVDLDELYEWGWSEISRLQARARTIAIQICGSPNVSDAAELLDRDPQRKVAVGEPLREWLQHRLDQASAHLDGSWFD